MGGDALFPWDSQGQFSSGRFPANPGKGLVNPLMGDTVLHFYVGRFGAPPNALVWEDFPNDPVVNWGISFRRYNQGVGTVPSDPPWGSSLYWIDLKDYVYWVCWNVKADTTVFIPPTGIPDSTLISYVWDASNGWDCSFKLHLRDLPVPKIEGAWRITMILTTDVDDPQKTIFTSDDWIFFIRTKRETAIDSFMWADTEHLLDDNSVLQPLLNSFPNSQLLLQRSFRHYMAEENCDSLRSIASRWLYYRNAMIEPLVGHGTGGPASGMAEIDVAVPAQTSFLLIDYLHQTLYEVCGDSTIPAWQP